MTTLGQKKMERLGPRTHVSTWLWLVVCLAITASQASFATASSGDRTTLPGTVTGKPGFSGNTGLQLVVDSTWSGNRGYRPIRLTVTSAKPAAGDTQLTIRYSAGTWRQNERTISVEHDFELPQGALTATTQFLVPQYTDWNTVEWEVWVDGAKDDALSMPKTGFSAGVQTAAAVGRFDMGTLARGAIGGSLVQSVLTNAIEEQTLEVGKLPDSWLEYSSLDVITTNPKTLEFAQVSAPDKLAHLLRWVRAGGNLWVLNVGSDFDQLDRVERVISAKQHRDAPKDAEIPLDDWRFLQFDQKGRQRLNDIVTMTMDPMDDSQKLTRTELADNRFPDTALDSRRWFVGRAYGLGTVVAIQDVGPGRRQNATTTTLRRSAVSDNLNWALRHGNDPGKGNPNFNQWLIADVGAAPVFEFQMLITLFAITIGPVNYWLLKRRNKLPMMLVTVPIAALVATVLLFVYGFLADGISTRARARTITVLDQVEGELATWSRLSYYAGIAPSDGLEMPNDTAIYPVLPSRSEYTAFGGQRVKQQRVVEWQEQQKLTRGWLGSRTPTQYLTQTAKPTEKELRFSRQGERLSVSNQLGTGVRYLVVQDHDGNVFVAENLKHDGSLALEPSDFSDASSQLRRYFSENLLQLPPGYVENGRNRRREYGNSMTEGLMELHFEAMTIPQATGWGDGTYVAITEGALELSLGLPDANETESFHVVRGKW